MPSMNGAHEPSSPSVLLLSEATLVELLDPAPAGNPKDVEPDDANWVEEAEPPPRTSLSDGRSNTAPPRAADEDDEEAPVGSTARRFRGLGIV
jgi:hypothetical protein